ncbi:MAG: hypothetical protein FD173_970 [Gallionellaceae bacterium]|nr:MAG: hypothetical protein FD173_970 [Gallionellaceae bacterium]
MGKRSKVEQLPKPFKEWLDKALVEGNFSDYKLLEAELKAHGCDISRSSLHRYGQRFEERIKTLKLVTEQARAVVAAAPDEDGAVNDALVRLTQEKLFDVLMKIEVDPENVDLAKLAKAVAELGKASVMQKRWQQEARQKALSEAANAVGEAAQAQGMDATQVDFWRGKVLGLANG